MSYSTAKVRSDATHTDNTNEALTNEPRYCNRYASRGDYVHCQLNIHTWNWSV